MNLLREYIRELLTERRVGTIHPKMYDMISRADENGYKVEVTNHSVIIYDNAERPRSIVAQVNWQQDPMHGPCLNSFIVTNASATTGFGPLAYDVAIEVTGGLTSDRTQVSDEAEKVWDYYTKYRKDVQVDQLDIDYMNSYGEDQLTPDDKSDDCVQVPAYSKYGPEWADTSLSKKISKQGRPVYNELRSRGMII